MLWLGTIRQLLRIQKSCMLRSSMNMIPFKKTIFIAGAALFLAACQPNGPDIEALKKLRDADSGIEITNSRIKSVTEINETLSLYDIEGMFKYRDGRYQYLTDFGDIKIYTPLNSDSTEPFNATIIAAEVDKNWQIVDENLPEFKGPLGSLQEVVTHNTLFANSEELMPGFFTNADGVTFALNDKTLDKYAKALVKGYEANLKLNLELDKKLEKIEKELSTLHGKLEKDAEKSLSDEKLKGEALTQKLAEILPAILEESGAYQTLVTEKAHIEAEIKALHQEMPKFWEMNACYDTAYRFYGRICNQITSANRSYLPEIRYQNRPDTKLEFMK